MFQLCTKSKNVKSQFKWSIVYRSCKRKAHLVKIYQLRQPETCREDYEDRYGPQYKAVTKFLTYKENRVNRRVVKYTGQSICKICQEKYQGVIVHLRRSKECKKGYEYETDENMRTLIQTENAKFKKQRETQREKST